MSSTSTAPAERHALGSEFEHEPVPVAHRRSSPTVPAAWSDVAR